MSRYLVLYLHCLRFSFSRAMEFRVDFFFRVGMDVLWYAVHLVFFWAIYQHAPLLGGWDFDQALVFAAGLFVADAVHMTLFSNNAWMFPLLVNRGDLDYYLVRPVSSLFFLSLREFAANSFLNLVIAVGVLAWALARYPGPLEATAVSVYVALLLLGCFITYCLHFLFMVPVFWMHNAAGLRDTFYGLNRFTARPDAIYTGWVRRVLTTLLPYAILVSFPTRALFESDVGAIAGHMGLVAAALFALLLVAWRRGLRAYSSASS
ncbi:MAG: ABC-2 family transporter protein [Planctomycetota bacterium]|nr:ABC-2 family transporter protein [Planctomycetota bacterium]